MPQTPDFPTTVSQHLIDALKAFEWPPGKPMTIYVDPAGVVTGGWGHIKGLKKSMVGQVVSVQLATQWLMSDLADAENEVRKDVKVSLSQAQFDALVDWTFNLGGGNLRGSTLLKKLNAGKFSEVPAEILRWDHAHVNGVLTVLPGLKARREWEAALFTSGTTTAVVAPAAPTTNDPSATVIPARPPGELWGWLIGAVLSFLGRVFHHA